ncbi:MAG: hypothetical protein HYV08_15730 [Deltaproteobacteria bacterium]|nr:hypothetical protein [Deltaproteobacteria bacterium]
MAVSKAEFGSDVVVDLLKLLGIEYTAFNPGATFRGIHDSIVNYGGNREPEVIECCHEEISVALAHGYAKASGKLMCAILHDIVGLQHGSMGIFNAWCDRVPVMVLGGTGPMDITKRRPWIDWIHTALVQGNLVRDYVKWDDQPANLASVPEALIRAYRIAVTEPKAPVYVNFDADIQEEVVTEPPLIPELRRYRPPGPIQGDPTAMEQAAAWLVGAEHPVIIADMVGRNSKAAEALVRLAELLGAAVLDKGARYNFPSTHPLDLSGADRELLAEADVVLALDMSDHPGGDQNHPHLPERAAHPQPGARLPAPAARGPPHPGGHEHRAPHPRPALRGSAEAGREAAGGDQGPGRGPREASRHAAAEGTGADAEGLGRAPHLDRQADGRGLGGDQRRGLGPRQWGGGRLATPPVAHEPAGPVPGP